MIAREHIVAAARGWIGTPYHHQASVKGVGCDCLGLIRGVWRVLCGPEPEALPAYTRDWGDATGSETLMEAGCRHLTKLADVSLAQEGDVLVFRMHAGVAKHAGIVSALPASGLLERDSAPPASGLLERDGLFSALPASGLLERDGLFSALPASGLLERDACFIHAQEEIGVAEVALTRWWRRRAVAAFAFPGVTP